MIANFTDFMIAVSLTGNWKLETGNWKLETGNWKL